MATGDASKAFYFNSVLYEAKRAAESGDVNDGLMNELEKAGNEGLFWYDALCSRATVMAAKYAMKAPDATVEKIRAQKDAVSRIATGESLVEVYNHPSKFQMGQLKYVLQTRHRALEVLVIADRLLALKEGTQAPVHPSLFARLRDNIQSHLRKYQDPKSPRGTMNK